MIADTYSLKEANIASMSSKTLDVASLDLLAHLALANLPLRFPEPAVVRGHAGHVVQQDLARVGDNELDLVTLADVQRVLTSEGRVTWSFARTVALRTVIM